MIDTIDHLHNRMAKQEVKDFDSLVFKQSLEIYKSSFPPNERRPIEKIVEMLKNDENYHLFNLLYNNLVVAISTIYVFKSLGVGLLGYMAVTPNYQRRGIGKKLFEFVFEKFKSDISNGIGLLVEIQKENVLDLQERIVRKNRIKFYLGLGAKIMNGVDYILPPIQPGFGPEEMYLMIIPLGDLEYLSKDSVIKYIDAIYRTIYQYSGNDLLNLISQKLPGRIILRDGGNLD